jgi:hypothetical protein
VGGNIYLTSGTIKFGAKQENGTWRKRYSNELHEIFN